jgi:hypothetical protein
MGTDLTVIEVGDDINVRRPTCVSEREPFGIEPSVETSPSTPRCKPPFGKRAAARNAAIANCGPRSLLVHGTGQKRAGGVVGSAINYLGVSFSSLPPAPSVST